MIDVQAKFADRREYRRRWQAKYRREHLEEMRKKERARYHNISDSEKARRREVSKQYYLDHRAHILANSRKGRSKRQAWRRKRVYGITPEQFEQFLVLQKRKCPGCGIRFSKQFLLVPQSVHVDHDHKTGKVRGILCSRCNMALGLLWDSKKVLQNLIFYLKFVAGIPDTKA